MQERQITAGNSRTLYRVVALLLSMAIAAESAAGRSLALCRLVLWILRPGEVFAGAYLAALMQEPCGPPAPLRLSDDRAEVLRLAASFRVLAAALAMIAEALETRSQPAIVPVRRSQAGASAACPGLAVVVGRLDSS